ncbi:hypothetical protein GCM10010404_05500 [Nonomuraea africana]|uniref:DUF998 domain-containing protein n=1 Tax=Nonomuraea africana TaxID=46171 RepID=A0ABR9KL16_9ACTN|nr:DUF998 domain-containing protein [Nonomuraea africana]MBE1562704.1 hypothetical protein [Nonomuraea africana]
MKGLLIGGFTTLGTGTGAMLTLQTQAGLDPLHTLISEYAFHPIGWLLPASLTLFAVGAAFIAEGLRRSGAGRGAASLVVVWGVCMLLLGLFPTDPPGFELSMSGAIHRYAGFVAFLVMPVAGLLLVRAKAHYARAMKALSGVAIAALVLVVLPYLVRMAGIPVDNADIPAGLTQRLVVLSEVGLLLLLGLHLVRLPQASGHRTPRLVTVQHAAPAAPVAAGTSRSLAA